MSLNLGILKELQLRFEKADKKDDILTYASKIEGSKTIRILPCDSLNGIFYLETINYWLPQPNSRSYTSLSTFGLSCPIEEELAEAMNNRDITIVEKAGQFKKDISFRMPVLIIDDNGEVAKDNPKIFSCTRGTGKKILNIILSKNGQDITDRVTGRALTITKTGSGLTTKYDILTEDKEEMHDKYYTMDYIPDPVAITAKMTKHPSYLRALVREVLYGEPIPEGLDKLKFTLTGKFAAVTNESSVYSEPKKVSPSPSATIGNILDELDDLES